MRTAHSGGAALVAAVVACGAGTAAGQYVKLMPSDGVPYAMFGFSASIQDDLLVGAPGYPGNMGEYDFGAVYVYQYTGGAWTEAAKLTASDPQEYDEFGASVAMSGDTAIIGVPRWGNGPGSRAYIFQRQRSGWTEVQTIHPSEYADAFGETVAIDGDRLIVGATEWWTETGKAYVFELVAGEWVEVAQLAAPDGRELDRFAGPLHLDGDLAVIGAPGRDLDAQERDEGAVFVFGQAGGVWSLTATITAPVPASNGYFGQSLAMDGDTLLVGSPGFMSPGGAYLFERSGDLWTPVAELTAPDSHNDDRFGVAVAMKAGTALVAGAENSVYIFQESPDGLWSFRTKIVSPDGEGSFGRAVVLGDENMAIGAFRDDDMGNVSGSLYVADIPHERSADFNGDGAVNTQDVLDFLGAWSQHDGSADWDWSWRLDTRDVLAFLNDWVAG